MSSFGELQVPFCRQHQPRRRQLDELRNQEDLHEVLQLKSKSKRLHDSLELSSREWYKNQQSLP